MLTITKSHLRRLTATILIGGAILLPAVIGRAPAQDDPAPAPAATTATLPAAMAL
jgi:hypothetical protein